MTKVQVIEEQIKQLSPRELAELREWLAEHDWAEWDRQIERDSASGKLDKLFATARADHAAGKSTKLFSDVPRASNDQAEASIE